MGGSHLRWGRDACTVALLRSSFRGGGKALLGKRGYMRSCLRCFTFLFDFSLAQLTSGDKPLYTRHKKGQRH